MLPSAGSLKESQCFWRVSRGFLNGHNKKRRWLDSVLGHFLVCFCVCGCVLVCVCVIVVIVLLLVIFVVFVQTMGPKFAHRRALSSPRLGQLPRASRPCAASFLKIS